MGGDLERQLIPPESHSGDVKRSIMNQLFLGGCSFQDISTKIGAFFTRGNDATDCSESLVGGNNTTAVLHSGTQAQNNQGRSDASFDEVQHESLIEDGDSYFFNFFTMFWKVTAAIDIFGGFLASTGSYYAAMMLVSLLLGTYISLFVPPWIRVGGFKVRFTLLRKERVNKMNMRDRAFWYTVVMACISFLGIANFVGLSIFLYWRVC